MKRIFKLPWREAGPPHHHNDKVDSDQYVVNAELSLSMWSGGSDAAGTSGLTLTRGPFIEKGFQFENFDAVKFTTQPDLY